MTLLALLNAMDMDTKVRVFDSAFSNEVLYEGEVRGNDNLKPHWHRKVILVRPSYKEEVIKIYLMSLKD